MEWSWWTWSWSWETMWWWWSVCPTTISAGDPASLVTLHPSLHHPPLPLLHPLYWNVSQRTRYSIYWGHPVSAKCTLPNTTHLHCTRMYITLFTLSTTWTPCTPTITWTPCTTTITWIPYTPTLTWTPCTLTRTWTPCTTSTTSALSVILQYTGMFCSILQYPICTLERGLNREGNCHMGVFLLSLYITMA